MHTQRSTNTQTHTCTHKCTCTHKHTRTDKHTHTPGVLPWRRHVHHPPSQWVSSPPWWRWAQFTSCEGGSGPKSQRLNGRYRGYLGLKPMFCLLEVWGEPKPTHPFVLHCRSNVFILRAQLTPPPQASHPGQNYKWPSVECWVFFCPLAILGCCVILALTMIN